MDIGGGLNTQPGVHHDSAPGGEAIGYCRPNSQLAQADGDCGNLDIETVGIGFDGFLEIAQPYARAERPGIPLPLALQ